MLHRRTIRHNQNFTCAFNSFPKLSYKQGMGKHLAFSICNLTLLLVGKKSLHWLQLSGFYVIDESMYALLGGLAHQRLLFQPLHVVTYAVLQAIRAKLVALSIPLAIIVTYVPETSPNVIFSILECAEGAVLSSCDRIPASVK